MQDLPGYRTGPNVVTWVILITVGFFVVQSICAFWFRWPGFTNFLGAQPDLVVRGQIWKLLTYALLHAVAPGQLLHIFFNMLMVHWVGRTVLDEVGPRRWLWIYITCAFFGSVIFSAIYLGLGRGNSLLLGASASVYGLIAFISTLHPERPAFLFFFEMRQKYIAYIFGGIALFGFIIWEIPSAGGTAHSAHLAGMLGGYLIARFGWFTHPFAAFPEIQMPGWWKRRKALKKIKNYSVNIEGSEAASPEPTQLDEKFYKAEVDRILDKINSKGFQSLSTEERELLDKAKEFLNRRN